jgi:hypothetical protein
VTEDCKADDNKFTGTIRKVNQSQRPGDVMGKFSKRSSPKLAPADPDFEVKLYLDPAKVLDIEFKPTRDVQHFLCMPEQRRKLSMAFIDARPVLIQPEGWNVRVRRAGDKEGFELTYKRRYPVTTGDLADALAAAMEDGFHAGEHDYAPQVEWGYQKQTLTFSLRKAFDAESASNMDVPALDDVRMVAIAGLPGKLERWKEEGWVQQILADGQLFGPALGKRWTALWQGPNLSFEVWLVKTESGSGYEPIVELSFKEDELEDAAGSREKLMAFTREQGWLLEGDVLKTEMILKRY